MLLTVLPQRTTMLRHLRRLTQAQLSALSGVAASTIAAIETGQTKGVNLKTLLRLCGVFEVTPDYILGIRENHTLARAFAASMELDHAPLHTNPVVCPRCNTTLRIGQPHPPGECMAAGRDGGQSREYLAASWGFGIAAVDAILADEYNRRPA